jgi:cell division protease FtsH
MSEKIGPAVFNQAEEHPFLGKELAQPRDFSEFTARIIDEEVLRIILEQENRAIEMLERHRTDLDKIAASLEENETLENSDIERLLKSEENGSTGDAKAAA